MATSSAIHLADIDADLAAHEAETTTVHGITDTSTLYRPGGTDVALADGGTGASTAAGARTNLDVPSNAEAVLDSLFDANTVLAADTDNTPAALTMGASTILARLAAGNIKAATPAELRTLLDVPTTGEAILDALVDAKGDLIAGTAADTVARVAAGANGTVLTADSTQTPGVRWATPISGNDILRNGQDGIVAPTCRGWTDGSQGMTANRLTGGRFVLLEDKTISLLRFFITVVGTGNVDIGILSSTGTRLASSGSVAAKKGTVGIVSVNLTGSIALTAGTVYYAVVVSDTGDGSRLTANWASVANRLFGTTLGLSEAFFRDASFPIPSDCSSGVTTATIAQVVV